MGCLSEGVPDDRLPGFPIWVDAWVECPSYDESTPRWKVDFLRKNSAFYLEHQAFLDGWLAEAWDDDGMTVRDFPLSRGKFEWQAISIHPERFGPTLWDSLSSSAKRDPGEGADILSRARGDYADANRRVVAPQITPMEASSLQGLPFEPFRRLEWTTRGSTDSLETRLTLASSDSPRRHYSAMPGRPGTGSKRETHEAHRLTDRVPEAPSASSASARRVMQGIAAATRA